jgi:hypothetical protein
MIYGKFKYVTNSANELIGINSILDSLPVTHTNLCTDDDWCYVSIDGDITEYDLSLFSFEEVAVETALSAYQSIFPNSVLLDSGYFGHPERAENLQAVEPSESEKMLDPAKWGMPYKTD